MRKKPTGKRRPITKPPAFYTEHASFWVDEVMKKDIAFVAKARRFRGEGDYLRYLVRRDVEDLKKNPPK